MRRTIKIRCNGPNKHVNEVDVERAVGEEALTSVTRSVDFGSPGVPERIVLRCRECTDGRVIVTREMIERAR